MFENWSRHTDARLLSPSTQDDGHMLGLSLTLPSPLVDSTGIGSPLGWVKSLPRTTRGVFG